MWENALKRNVNEKAQTLNNSSYNEVATSVAYSINQVTKDIAFTYTRLGKLDSYTTYDKINMEETVTQPLIIRI